MTSSPLRRRVVTTAAVVIGMVLSWAPVVASPTDDQGVPMAPGSGPGFPCHRSQDPDLRFPVTMCHPLLRSTPS